MKLIGECLPTQTWGCREYSKYPREFTEPKDLGNRPPLNVGWVQQRFTSFELPRHVVIELQVKQ